MVSRQEVGNKTTRVLMVTAVPSLAAPVARNLAYAGYSVNLVSKEHLVGARFFPFVSRYKTIPALYWDPLDKKLLFAERLNQLINKWKIDVLLPVDIISSILVYKVRSNLKAATVPLFNDSQRIYFSNKWNFHCFLEKEGLPSPKTHYYTSGDSLEQLQLSFPLLIKPLDKAQGVGIAKFDSYAELNKALQERTESYPLIFQQYFPGIDYVVGILADHGKLLAWVMSIYNPGSNMRHIVSEEKILELTRAVIKKMAFTGVAAIDVRRDTRDDKFYFLETNLRFGGSSIYYPKVGVNLGALWIDMALNKKEIPLTCPSCTDAYIQLGVYDRVIRKFGGPLFAHHFSFTR